MDGALKLGLPSKGRLLAQTVDWFAARGVDIATSERDREYAGSIGGIEGVRPVFLAAGEIPRELAAGRLHLGVTGEDMVREKIAGWSDRIEIVERLGFGRADLVVAVPDFWADVETVADLDLAAGQFRANHGSSLRIATKYHNLARGFFRDRGVADYRLVDSQGATEGAVRNFLAEAIVDITTSGATLHANNLKTLTDGLILASEAVLCRSRTADWGGERESYRMTLADRLGHAPARDPRIDPIS
jgi:ATP phosphoribosyltransferase